MIVIGYVLWGISVVVISGAVVAAALAVKLPKPPLALLSIIPVGGGLLAAALEIDLLPSARAYGVVLAVGIAALGVLAGNPLTVHLLALATRNTVRRGAHGGILIERAGTGVSEVLRGGTTIGYLERLAIIGAFAVGHPEAIAALIAVKGLGRFSELDSAAARERFIIGTLASMIWASACGVLAVLATSAG